MQSEAKFKAAIIKLWKSEGIFDEIFCIETEETEPGFPDVMVKLNDQEVYKFFEFKVSDAKGLIEFTKNQPRFYLFHRGMDIQVLALDNRVPFDKDSRSMVMFPVSKIFEKGGQFELSDRRQVQL
jgi:hypothetical protein